MVTFSTSDGVEVRYECRGGGPPVYVCHGGPRWVASSGLHYALRHPATCERLALVAATPCGATGPMAIPALRALGPARTARALAVALWYLVAWSWRAPSTRRTRAMYAPMAVAQEARPELRAAVAKARSGLPVDNDNATHLLRAMGSLDMRNEVGRISCPVLVLYGSRDAVMVAGGQMLASGLRDPEEHVLDGVGHEPFIEQPDTTFSMLESFLGAGRARGP